MPPKRDKRFEVMVILDFENVDDSINEYTIKELFPMAGKHPKLKQVIVEVHEVSIVPPNN